MKFTLYGTYDNSTEQARRVLDKSGIEYSLIRTPEKDYDGNLVVVTPAGRFSGLETIKAMFEIK
jgi:hypothetical protein